MQSASQMHGTGWKRRPIEFIYPEDMHVPLYSVVWCTRDFFCDFDMRCVQHHNPSSLWTPRPAMLIRYVTLCRRCDVITVNVPLFDSTRDMFDEDRIGKMKDGAFLVRHSILLALRKHILYRVVTHILSVLQSMCVCDASLFRTDKVDIICVILLLDTYSRTLDPLCAYGGLCCCKHLVHANQNAAI